MKNTCVSHNNPFADIRIWRDEAIGQLIMEGRKNFYKAITATQIQYNRK